MPASKELINILKTVKEKPIVSIFMLSGWLFSLWLGYLSELAPYKEKHKAQIIDAHKRLLDAQYKLKLIQEIEVSNTRDMLQQVVDMFDVPAWVKYLDPTTQKFIFIVVNEAYSDFYGVPFQVQGLNDRELYKSRELTQLQLATITEYEVNDRKALSVGPGKCIKVQEHEYPVDVKIEDKINTFKKCMLFDKVTSYVFGHRM